MSNWVYDSGKEYDIYYSGGQDSIYNQLYKNKCIDYDKWFLTKIIRQIALTTNTVKILDFGCGNGRYFQIFENIANILQKENKSLYLIAYDASLVALEYFQSQLVEKNFCDLPVINSTNEYTIRDLKKGNITVRFIHPSRHNSINLIAQVTERVNLTVCLFSVLSHIQTSQERVNLIKVLKKLTDGYIVASLPSYRILQNEHKVFKFIRLNNFRMSIDGLPLSLEKGDILYARNFGDKHVENYLHLYESSEEIRDELAEAGITNKYNISIHKILHETTMIKYNILGILDKYVCRILSFISIKWIQDKIAAYYLLIIDNSDNKN